MMKPLFIRQGLDGVVAGGAQSGVERAQEGSHQGDGAGDGPPGIHDNHGQGSGHKSANEPPGAVAHEDADNCAADPEDYRLGQNDPQDKALGGAERFENADFARALQHRHIHGEANRHEADHYSDPHDDVDELGHAVDIAHAPQGGELLHGIDLQVGPALNVLHHRVVIGRIVQLDPDLADFALDAVDVLEGWGLHHDARQFAAFDDADDVPVVIHQRKGLADLKLFLRGVQAIDQDIVRAAQLVSLDVFEAAAHPVELLGVDARHHHRKIDQVVDDPRGHCDVGNLGAEEFDIALGDGRGTKVDHAGCGRSANYEIGADASGAILRILQHAVGQTDQCENQRDGNADQQEAEQAAHGFVFQVFENQLGGHGRGPFLGGATRAGGGTGGWPIGCKVV